jgi:hypothetical protein
MERDAGSRWVDCIVGLLFNSANFTSSIWGNTPSDANADTPMNEPTQDEDQSVPGSDVVVDTQEPHTTGKFNAQVQHPELMPSEGELLLWKAEPPNPVSVEIGDSVRYLFSDEPDDIAFVTLVTEFSNPNIGTVNQDTAIGRALRGLRVGDERTVELPIGKRQLKVLEILKSSRNQ